MRTAILLFLTVLPGIAFVGQESTEWIGGIAIFKRGSARRIWKF